MSSNKIVTMALVLPLTLVSLTGFAGDDTEQKLKDGDKTDLMVETKSLVADSKEKEDEFLEDAVIENMRTKTLTESDTDEVGVEEDNEKR